MAQLDQITVLIRGQNELSGPTTAAIRSLQGLDKQVEHTDSRVGGLTRTLGGLGKGLALGAGFGAAQAAIGAISSSLGGLGGALIGSNVELENTRAQLVAMTKSGPAAEKILADIRTEAAKTPFAFQEMAKATVGLMPAAKQAGVPLMDLIKQAEILAASNPAEGLEGAAFALREAVSGDFTSVIERFNLPRQRINELKKQGVPALKAITTAMKELGLDATLVSKRAETLEGRWSTFLDTLQTTAATVGEPLFDVLKDSLVGVQTFLDANAEAITAWAKSIGEFLGGSARRLISWLGDVGSTLGRELAVWRDAFAEGGLGGLFEQAADEIASGRLLNVIRDVGTRVGSVLRQGFEAARDVAGSIVEWLGRQIARIDWRAVWAFATNTAAGLVAGLGSVVSDVTAWLGRQWAAIRWSEVWASVTEIGAGLLSGAASIASTVTTWVSTQWANIDWGAVWGSVTGLVTGLLTGLGDIGRAVTAWVGVQWAKINWDAVWKEVKGHGAALVKSLDPITADVQTWLVAQWTAIKWDQVFAAAGTGAEMTRSLETEINKIEVGGPIGRAMARVLIGTIKYGVEAATGPAGGFAEAGPLMVAAWLREMAMFPFFVLGWVRREFLEAIKQGLAEGVALLNLAQFTTDLKAKVFDAVTAIFPIKAGPLTIGLSGVTLAPVVVHTPFEGPPAAVKPGLGGGGPTIPGFQTGGSFYVGGRGGADSQYVAFRATPGERVDVSPPGRGPGGPVVLNVANTFHVADRADADYLVDVLPAALARALEKARTQQGMPVVSGLVRWT